MLSGLVAVATSAFIVVAAGLSNFKERASSSKMLHMPNESCPIFRCCKHLHVE